MRETRDINLRIINYRIKVITTGKKFLHDTMFLGYIYNFPRRRQCVISIFFFHWSPFLDLAALSSSLIPCHEFISSSLNAVRLYTDDGPREKDPTPLSANEKCWAPTRNVMESRHVRVAHIHVRIHAFVAAACVGRTEWTP